MRKTQTQTPEFVLARIHHIVEIAKHLAAAETAHVRYHEHIPAVTDRVVSLATGIVNEIYRREITAALSAGGEPPLTG